MAECNVNEAIDLTLASKTPIVNGFLLDSLSHLPLAKQQELDAITQAIRNHPEVEMIILFGSYARDDWVEEYKEDGIHLNYQSDFDILVVVETCNTLEQTRLENEIKKAVKALSSYYTPLSLLVHDSAFVNQRLSKAQYFFLDIKREGKVLYDSGKIALASLEKMRYAMRSRLAMEDFDYWRLSAGEFLKDFRNALERKSYNQAAFLLHQATERLYCGILLVLTYYKSNTHQLEELRSYVNTLDSRFLNIFSLDTPEKHHRFILLCKAYVDARYNKDYVITEEELQGLLEEVEVLTQEMETVCQEKILYFLQESIKELSEENISNKKRFKKALIKASL